LRPGAHHRDIAQTLFVTARTVETHLTSVFAKLEVKARTDLSEALLNRTPQQIVPVSHQ
jgi:DNA-binding NarL/FixJ family response regulator